MYKLIYNLFNPSILHLCSKGQLFEKTLIPIASTYIQSRNTYILRRRYPTKLYRKGTDYIRFKGKDYVYDLVENTDVSKKPEIKIVLKKYVEGLGQRGEVVTVKRNIAYNNLLLTGIADYATPEAIEKANAIKERGNEDVESSSSLTAVQAVKYLENQLLAVVMNKETKWTIQPWHIRVSFRKAGIHVPEECILLPKNPISGPDLTLEEKEFFINVIINNKERASVRCKIHHWSSNIADRLPYNRCFWNQKSEAVFPEDTERLRNFGINPSLKINSDENLKV